MQFLKSIFKVRGLKATMSFRDLLILFVRQWRLFSFLAVVACLCATGLYYSLRSYQSTASLLIHDPDSSMLQAFTKDFSGKPQGASVQASKDNIQKMAEYLRSYEFYKSLSYEIHQEQGSEFLSSEFVSKEGSELVEGLRSLIKVSTDSDFILRIQVSAKSPEQSVKLANRALEVAQQQLKAREMREVIQVQEFIELQKQQADARYQAAIHRLTDYQAEPQTAIGLGAGEKLKEYMSELLIRLSELDLKITENSQLIALLKGKEGASSSENSIFGPSQRIKELHSENELLSQKKQELNRAIAKISSQNSKLPQSLQRVEELEKKAELEFASYKELSDALTRTHIQKISIDNRFEILEQASLQRAKLKYSLLALLAVALFLAEGLGLLWIYLQFLFYSDEQQGGISPLVYDEGLVDDPRVFIEDGRVRFKAVRRPSTSAEEAIR